MGGLNRQFRGIVYIAVAAALFSLQDAVIKWLSPNYPLHEIVLIRSVIASLIIGCVIYWEGGISILATSRPDLHLARALLILVANSCFFLAIAAMPLAEAMAIFFVAPLFITALSALLLREYVGFRQWLGVALGMIGVLIVLRPEPSEFSLVGLLSLVAAFAYACMQMVTRRLGKTDRASTMTFYVQVMFITASLLMGLTVGDGRFAPDDNPSLNFLLRAWILPSREDAILLFGAGILSAIGAYFMSQAYRISEASVLAPFEYVALPFSIFWGYWFWEELPDQQAMLGIGLILISGLYVFYRQAKYHRLSVRNDPSKE